MRTDHRIVRNGLWMAASLVLAAIPLRETRAATTVTWDGQFLSARIAGAPLEQVMAEIGRATGAELRWQHAAAGPTVTVELAAVSLPEGLRRILGEGSFQLIFSRGGGRLARIWISPAGGHEDQAEQSRTSSGPKSAVDRLIDSAVDAEDPQERLEAMTQLARSGRDDPYVTAILDEVVRSDRDRRVRETIDELLGTITEPDAPALGTVSVSEPEENDGAGS